MEGLLGRVETPQDKSNYLGGVVGSEPFSSTHLFTSTNHSENHYPNQNQNSLQNPFISPSVSIPNPKRANPIDFLGLTDPNAVLMVPNAHTPQAHDRFGSSFSHLSTETRSELTALGVSISRAKSSDAPTPDPLDPLALHQTSFPWQQSRSALGFQSSGFLSEPPLEDLQQRIISPRVNSGLAGLAPGSALGGAGGSGLNLNLNDGVTENQAEVRAWPFVDKPPGLLSRATSSLGISSMQQTNILNSLTRPVSTPAYLNKNNDSLSALGLGLGLGNLGMQSNQSGLLMSSEQRGLQFETQRSDSINHSFPSSHLGSEFVNLTNPLGGFGALSLEPNEESRWPKPVRYARPMESADHLLGSIIRPSSVADGAARSSGLSPLSNADRFSISPKPVGERIDSKMHSVSREVTPPPTNARISPKLSITAVDDRAIENVIATNCHHILLDAAEHSLKAVELANTLRARVGTEVLAIVRERWGGLLSLLERHPEKFLVERIPKNDRVSLYTATHAQGLQPSSNGVEGGKEEGTGERDDGEGLSTDPQQASRCLHVGNVPTSYTEVQLMREFEKFGQLDGLKLISQKNGNRRFAFVTYKTLSQAITARHCLSKVHPWKSAISFAHRDFSNNNNNGMGGGMNMNGNGQNKARGDINNNGNGAGGVSLLNKLSPQKPSSQQSNMYENGHLPYHQTNLNSNQGHPGFHNNRTHQNMHYNNGPAKHWDNVHQQPHQQLHHHQQQHPHQMSSHQLSVHDSFMSNESSILSDHLSGKTSNYQGINAPIQNQQTSNSLSYSNIASKASQHQTTINVSSNSKPEGSGGGGLIGTHPTIESFPDKNALQIILTRLCDDKYVPTQPWPIDTVADVPFCQAVIDQVSHFGGSTTISKLRGFLKHRVGTVDNIKSVPLKAMLLAYRNLFHVEGNLVSLVNDNQAHSTKQHAVHHDNAHNNDDNDDIAT